MYDPKDRRIVHETILKDIVDVLSDIKDIDEIEFELGKNKSFKSIASATSNLTLVFPVVCTSDIDITNAMMTSKAIERKCVAMLQMLFSAFTINDAEDAIQYISKFHTNMRMTDRMDMDTFVGYVDQFVKKLDEEAPITVDRTKYEAVKEDFKKPDFYLDMDCISEHSISEYYVYSAGMISSEKVVIREAKRDPKDDWITAGIDGINDANQNISDLSQNSHKLIQNIIDDHRQDTRYYQRETQRANREREKLTDQITKMANQNMQNIRSAQQRRNNSDDAQYLKNQSDYFSKQILPSDIKKANELMPTNMIVNFVTPGKDGGDAILTSAVIGVKAKLYPVSSMDIIDRVKTKNKDSNGFNKFIRATTREISFWKDFVFAVEKAKLDALSSSRRGSSSPVWKLLERRALKSRIRRTFRMTNDATAITTLVMSQNEIEWLLKNENINMMNSYTARSLMESFNLMGIAVVDESVEVAKFIFDTGDDEYESLTFSALERESSDNTYKRVVNLMTKMGR